MGEVPRYTLNPTLKSRGAKPVAPIAAAPASGVRPEDGNSSNIQECETGRGGAPQAQEGGGEGGSVAAPRIKNFRR